METQRFSPYRRSATFPQQSTAAAATRFVPVSACRWLSTAAGPVPALMTVGPAHDWTAVGPAQDELPTGAAGAGPAPASTTPSATVAATRPLRMILCTISPPPNGRPGLGW